MKRNFISNFKSLFLAFCLSLAAYGCSEEAIDSIGSTITQCADGIDNDNDSLTDLNDPACANAADNDESDDPISLPQCADGVDNDNDSLTDLNDPGCANAADNDESDAPVSSVHDAARANSYDNAWESAWVANAKTILSTPVLGVTKIAGKVLQVGDSMTHADANGRWARSGAGRTADDLDTILWMHADSYNIDNGWFYSSNGTTAMGGADWGWGFVDMIYTDPSLNDAQFAVLMFNSTDINFVENRLNEFIAVGIVPVVSTIPPRTNLDSYVNISIPYNIALRALAEKLHLPIIDYEEEILLRRPDGTWEDTLIGPDGVHPSSASGLYDAESNPYDPGGDPTTHTTGEALLYSGYLLRTWLTVQKIKEIKQKVVD